MVGKKKKEKKAPKENKDQISNVDKTFYELTINDLNNKLAHLRTQNIKLEEENEELESRMHQLEEDRSDVTAFLNRTLNTQSSNIRDLEEKLSELAKVRSDEMNKFQAIIKDWEVKYKAMHDQLTSEIKLLTGKLNSLEEFRIQKDELMAKFDQQETALREQMQRHKDTVYELERKQILDKNRLKNEVESRLLQLSNEFVRTNEIRIAAHVQRLFRENIALNNELECLLHAQRRLKGENELLNKKITEQRRLYESIQEENTLQVVSCQKHSSIISKLSADCDKMKKQLKSLEETEKMKHLAELRETTARKELNELKAKMQKMDKSLNKEQRDSKLHLTTITEDKKEIGRFLDIFKQLKQTVQTAIESDGKESEAAEHLQRKNLVRELQGILLHVAGEDEDFVDSNGDTLQSLSKKLFARKKTGVFNRENTRKFFKMEHLTYKGRKPSVMDLEGADGTADKIVNEKSPECCEIIDVDDGITLESGSTVRDDIDQSVDENTVGMVKPQSENGADIDNY